MAPDTNNIDVDATFDIVIVGSGAGGLTTAIVGASLGLKVLVLEKTDVFGGTTAISGGGLWIPGNHLMASLGLTDSPQRAMDYLRAITGNFFEPRKSEVFLENGPRMLRFLEDNSQVCFSGGLIPDYEPSQPGAATGRTLLSPAYDGKELGSDLALLRPALDQFGAFGGMQIGFEDAMPFMKATRSLAAFTYAAGKFFRYVWDRLRYGRTTRLVNGNALAARLLRSARLAGVTLWRECGASDLIVEAGCVTGVIVKSHGRSITVKATRAVVLASGGYGANQQMRRGNVPLADDGWSLQPEGNQGDGIRLGQSVGGTFVRANLDNGIWAPMSSMVGKGRGRGGRRDIVSQRRGLSG